MRGPLDMLSQEWMPTATTTHFAMDWPLQQDLEEMRMVATERRRRSSSEKKSWFDRTSTICDFQIGDEFLVFMPDNSSSKKGKLDDAWAGPYELLGKISPVTYAIDRPDQRRKNAAVHVTAMKKWMPLIADTLFLFT